MKAEAVSKASHLGWEAVNFKDVEDVVELAVNIAAHCKLKKRAAWQNTCS